MEDGKNMYGDRFGFYIKKRIQCLRGGNPPSGGGGSAFWLDPGYLPPPAVVSPCLLRGVRPPHSGGLVGQGITPSPP